MLLFPGSFHLPRLTYKCTVSHNAMKRKSLTLFTQQGDCSRDCIHLIIWLKFSRGSSCAFLSSLPFFGIKHEGERGLPLHSSRPQGSLLIPNMAVFVCVAGNRVGRVLWRVQSLIRGGRRAKTTNSWPCIFLAYPFLLYDCMYCCSPGTPGHLF